MEKLFKQFEVLVTRLKAEYKSDEFFSARIKLTFFYSFIIAVILGIASFLLYRVLILNFTELLRNEFINPFLAERILERAQNNLQNRIFTIDMTILSISVVLGFFLTQKTLVPIKKSTEKQKRFIADASHELRTPVAIVISGLEIALRNKDFSPDSAKLALEKSLQEMREFSVLSNTLLDITKYDNKIESPKSMLDVRQILGDVADKMQSIAEGKSISIHNNLKHSAIILGDKAELERLFFNIFSNAVSYSDPGAVIYVSDELAAGKYIINIKDTGKGMSGDTLKKVFDPFFRGDGARSTSGAGLGLTLAKKIVEAHEGSIGIESMLGQGTEVRIILPAVS